MALEANAGRGYAVGGRPSVLDYLACGADAMNDPLQPKHCAEMLGALAAPERLKIVRFLRDGPKNVSQIAAMLATAVVNVSHHLSVLKHAGLVRNEKKGRFVYYSLTEGVLQEDGKLRPIEHLDLGCCRLELPTTEKVDPPQIRRSKGKPKQAGS